MGFDRSRVARAVLAATVAVGAVLVATIGGAGAGAPATSVVTIGKVVVGTATSGSVVRLACPSPEEGGDPVVVNFTFDAQGLPVSADAFPQAISIVDGEFRLSGNSNVIRTCTFTEIDAGGASSTAWTCDYTRDPPGPPDDGFGCAAASGAGPGPLTLTFGTPEDDIKIQDAAVVFTNTFDPPEISPTFTG